LGGHLVFGCRDQKKAKFAKLEIEKEFPKSKGKIELFELDLSDLNTVKKFSEKILEINKPIRLLINNAGLEYFFFFNYFFFYYF
jgi:short-subunit dehydrogenase